MPVIVHILFHYVAAIIVIMYIIPLYFIVVLLYAGQMYTSCSDSLLLRQPTASVTSRSHCRLSPYKVTSHRGLVSHSTYFFHTGINLTNVKEIPVRHLRVIIFLRPSHRCYIFARWVYRIL